MKITQIIKVSVLGFVLGMSFNCGGGDSGPSRSEEDLRTLLSGKNFVIDSEAAENNANDRCSQSQNVTDSTEVGNVAINASANQDYHERRRSNHHCFGFNCDDHVDDWRRRGYPRSHSDISDLGRSRAAVNENSVSISFSSNGTCSLSGNNVNINDCEWDVLDGNTIELTVNERTINLAVDIISENDLDILIVNLPGDFNPSLDCRPLRQVATSLGISVGNTNSPQQSETLEINGDRSFRNDEAENHGEGEAILNHDEDGGHDVGADVLGEDEAHPNNNPPVPFHNPNLLH